MDWDIILKVLGVIWWIQIPLTTFWIGYVIGRNN